MKSTTRKQIAAGSLIALLALTGCASTTAQGSAAAGASKTSDTTDISQGVEPDPEAIALLPQDIKDKGELTVAMDLHYPPTTFLADDNTTPIGLNPDIARLVAKKLGLKLNFENTTFDSIIPGIDGGRYDFTVTTMSPTAERLQVLDMIDYFSAGVSVAVPAGNPQNLTNDSLCGKNIAVPKGSNSQLVHVPHISEWTCTSQGKPAINAVVLPDVQAALTQLASKRVDGIFYDTTALAWAAEQQPNTFEVLTPQIDTRTSGITSVGLKKGSPLTPAMQKAIQSVLDSPQYTASLDNWGLSSGAITDAHLN